MYEATDFSEVLSESGSLTSLLVLDVASNVLQTLPEGLAACFQVLLNYIQ
jgi:hypothetical protein